MFHLPGFIKEGVRSPYYIRTQHKNAQKNTKPSFSAKKIELWFVGKKAFPLFFFNHFTCSLSNANLFLKLHVLSNGFRLHVTTSTQIAFIDLILRCIKVEADCRHSKSYSMSKRHSKRLHSSESVFFDKIRCTIWKEVWLYFSVRILFYRVIGFSDDNCNVMFCKNHSVSILLKEFMPNLLAVPFS